MSHGVSHLPGEIINVLASSGICWYGIGLGAVASALAVFLAYRARIRKSAVFRPGLRFKILVGLLFVAVWFLVAAVRHGGDPTFYAGMLDFPPTALARCPDEGGVVPSVTPPRFLDPFAFSALSVGFLLGFLTALSPCGLPILPAYIPFLLGKNPTPKRALVASGVTTTGFFITVVGIGAFLIFSGTLFGTNILFSYGFDLIAGSIVIAMGVVILLGIPLPFFRRPAWRLKKQGYPGILVFGITWSIAALTCSAPLFIGAIAYGVVLGADAALMIFLTYALGMGIPVIIVSVSIGFAKETIVERIIRLAPKLQKISGVVLIGVGIYIFSFYFNYGI